MQHDMPRVREMDRELPVVVTTLQRLALALEMSRVARQLLVARLSQEHPDWTRAEIEREMLRSAFLSEGRSVELPLPLR